MMIWFLTSGAGSGRVNEMGRSKEQHDWDWWHVVDMTTGKIVATGNS